MVFAARLFIMLFPGAAALALGKLGLNGNRFNVHTYVINLDQRVDRCECMSSQLKPIDNVFRQSAANFVKLPEQCEAMKQSDLQKKRSLPPRSPIPWHELSLFCSNYLIWEKAVNSSADYIVIMEDDLTLPTGWFETVNRYVEKCPEFDYLLVDPLRQKRWGKEFRMKPDFWTTNSESVTECALGETWKQKLRPSETMTATSQDATILNAWFTTSMQVIRRDALPSILGIAQSQGWAAIDCWWQEYLHGLRAYGWSGQIAHQVSQGDDNGHESRGKLKKLGCSTSVIDTGMEGATQKDNVGEHIMKHGDGAFECLGLQEEWGKDDPTE